MSDKSFSMGTSFNTSAPAASPAQPAAAPMQPPAQPAGALIKDSDTANFMADVIETSKSVPVIVDFWAPWCGPCKQLGPALEQVVHEAGGKVRMVKVNVDENQQLAQQMRVQSIPAVFAFANGQPVDGFMGALPESELRKFVDKISQSHGGIAQQLEELLEHADKTLAEENWQEAIAMYGAAIQAAPEEPRAIAGQLRCLIGIGELGEARGFADSLSDDLRAKDIVSSAIAALEIAETPVDNEEVARLRSAIEANAKDHASRLELSIALGAAGQREEALEHVLHIIEADRQWNDEAARKQLLTFFEAWGPMDELTIAGRRRLSSLLFS